MSKTQIISSTPESRAAALKEIEGHVNAIVESCDHFLARAPERERLYGAALVAHRPSQEKPTLDELLKRAHAELGR